jgi:ABC-type proline/glycine betaine transport system permease subunit
MNPVAALTRKGATPGQAATVVYGLPLLILATLGLMLYDRQTGEAALVVIAVSAPRALLCLVACWGTPGEGPVIPELPEWRAVHFNR